MASSVGSRVRFAAGRGQRVPGPPRGRRPSFLGDVLDRVDQMRNAEVGGLSGAALLRLLSDVILLLKDLATDARVPLRDKIVAGAAAAYLVTPVDLVPDFIPVAGQLDDVLFGALALRYALRVASLDVLREQWPGPSSSLDVVVRLAYGKRSGRI